MDDASGVDGQSSPDPLRQVRELLHAYEAGGPLQLLADAATILLRTARLRIVDPERGRLTFQVADACLGAVPLSGRLAHTVLDGGVQIVEAELASISGSHLDFVSETLLLAVHGALLAEWYHLEHHLEDLNSALEDVRSASAFLELPGLLDDQDRAWCWQTIAAIRQRQADLTHRVDHLGGVVDALEQARSAEGASDNLRAAIRWRLTGARLAYWHRVVATDPSAVPRLNEAVDEAIAELGDLVDNAPGHDIERRSWFQNLAAAHLERSQRPGLSPLEVAADLAAGLHAVDRGLEISPAGSADRVPLLETRGALLLAQSQVDDSVDAAAAMQTAFEAAAEHRHPEVGRAGHRLAMAYASAGRWSEAASVGIRTLEVLQSLVRLQAHQDYRWTVMRETAGLTGLAGLTAFAYVAAGRPLEGALVLERGQAIVLGDRYARPRAIHDSLLAQGRAAQAVQYLRVAAAVRELNASDQRLRRAEDELADVVAELRSLPGLGALLGPIDAASVIAAAAATTVVYLASSPFGGVALVIDGAGSAQAVDLPEVTDEKVSAVGLRFSRRVVSPANPPSLRSRTIAETCDWLGRAVMGPLGAALGRTSHVTLIPTGELAGLPLHAAAIGGQHDGAFPLSERCYTYSPSAVMLRPAVAALPDSTEALAVADPTRPGSAGLPGALREAPAVRKAFPKALLLCRRRATRDAVVDAISRVALVHLACHGVSDPADPMRSRLLLAREDLRLSELLGLRTDQLRLVVLSACQTAATDQHLPGESLSLAAGIVAASADAVIGSLWPVPDLATAALMERFYLALKAGLAPPDALRDAQLALATSRTTARSHGATTQDWTDRYQWAGFVYLGR
jgi:CHAT domain-containing protein